MGGFTPVDRPLLYPIVYTRLEAALVYYVPARIKIGTFRTLPGYGRMTVRSPPVVTVVKVPIVSSVVDETNGVCLFCSMWG